MHKSNSECYEKNVAKNVRKVAGDNRENHWNIIKMSGCSLITKNVAKNPRHLINYIKNVTKKARLHINYKKNAWHLINYIKKTQYLKFYCKFQYPKKLNLGFLH